MELIQLMPTMFFTGLGFWAKNPLPFMLAFACSMFNGLNWYDAFGTNEALAISLMLIAYAFVCAAFAYRYIFYQESE